MVLPLCEVERATDGWVSELCAGEKGIRASGMAAGVGAGARPEELTGTLAQPRPSSASVAPLTFFTTLSPQQLMEVGSTVTPILEMRKQSHREGKSVVRGHTATKW